MIIELATSNFDIDNKSRDFDHKISTDELYETHNRAWKEGIYVDDEQWQTLKKTAAAILVENSDTSSKGAGGVWPNIEELSSQHLKYNTTFIALIANHFEGFLSFKQPLKINM